MGGSYLTAADAAGDGSLYATLLGLGLVPSTLPDCGCWGAGSLGAAILVPTPDWHLGLVPPSPYPSYIPG